ncbi:MAG TPA: type II toxin-antitoxin system VapC family toxin [Thermohalobaculum sp.]|nr:type II toxin-antitoxin system VapC family toxin [Thermohalobaculum sp.]
MSAVIDASALLALLQEEAGGERVAEALSDAIISTVNVSEVVAKLCDKGFEPDEARETVELLPLNAIDFDLPQAMEAGMLRSGTRSQGLSLADRACLALAARSGGVALTTDRAWSQLDVGIEVELVR